MEYLNKKNMLLTSIGFDHFLNSFKEIEKKVANSNINSYPPYDIIRKDQTSYSIQIAVTGFSKNEIDIFSEGNSLFVKGELNKMAKDEFIYNGIPIRDFEYEFLLSDSAEVRSADLNEGLLVIGLENVIPEREKPRRIFIGKKASIMEKRKKTAWSNNCVANSNIGYTNCSVFGTKVSWT